MGGFDLGDWTWTVVRQVVGERVGLTLGRSGCLKYLHRLGFVLKRPKKRLLKANPERRAVFVREYALLRAMAATTGAKIFFADEAHCSADVDRRGTWVPKGEPALVGSTSPRYGEKARSSSAVCLETGEVTCRCRRTLHAQADALAPLVDAILQQPDHGDPTVAWV